MVTINIILFHGIIFEYSILLNDELVIFFLNSIKSLQLIRESIYILRIINKSLIKFLDFIIISIYIIIDSSNIVIDMTNCYLLILEFKICTSELILLSMLDISLLRKLYFKLSYHRFSLRYTILMLFSSIEKLNLIVINLSNLSIKLCILLLDT